MLKNLISILQLIQRFLEKNPDATFPDVPTPATPIPPVAPKYLFDTVQNARHSIRVICDEEGLTLKQKNDVTAVVEAESGFHNTAINHNRNAAGVVTSTDWGICQINDHYHIGLVLDFPSVQYVIDNPEKAVRWMVKMCKAGKLSLWSAYVNGSYKKFLPQNGR